VSNTQFNLSATPTVALGNACIQINGGGITFPQVTANATGVTYNAGWLMSSSPTRPVLFEDIANRSDYNYPCYQDGITLASNLYYPWGNGTANTTQGFYANSTGLFQPLNNADQVITPGSYGWEILTIADWTSDNLTSDEVVDETLTISGFSTGSNARVQICQFGITNTTPAGNIELSTNLQSDWLVIDDNFYQDRFNFTATLGASANVQYLGIATRNLTPNTSVYFTQVQFISSQRKIR
jgi:hypothetical protein